MDLNKLDAAVAAYRCSVVALEAAVSSPGTFSEQEKQELYMAVMRHTATVAHTVLVPAIATALFSDSEAHAEEAIAAFVTDLRENVHRHATRMAEARARGLMFEVLGL